MIISASLFLQSCFLELSIIIVNYNVKNFLEQCLYSVHAAIEGMEAEIFVVDNQSSDGSVEFLSKVFPGVILLKIPKTVALGLPIIRH